ncbi:MAG: SET domain-containing protein-lysine N-methyltransferase [Candidatus Bathyarchaeia archaeon]
MQLKRMPKVTVKICERLGPDQRGVFALEDIRKNQFIEISPALVFGAEEAELIDQTALDRYVFEWGEDGKSSAIGMGNVSLYNHSAEPNADYCQDFVEETFFVKAIEPIKKDEEITFNYNGSVCDKTPQWFEDTVTI